MLWCVSDSTIENSEVSSEDLHNLANWSDIVEKVDRSTQDTVQSFSVNTISNFSLSLLVVNVLNVTENHSTDTQAANISHMRAKLFLLLFR